MAVISWFTWNFLFINRTTNCKTNCEFILWTERNITFVIPDANFNFADPSPSPSPFPLPLPLPPPSPPSPIFSDIKRIVFWNYVFINFLLCVYVCVRALASCVRVCVRPRTHSRLKASTRGGREDPPCTPYSIYRDHYFLYYVAGEFLKHVLKE